MNFKINKKNIFKLVISAYIVGVVFVPVFAFAQGATPPAGGPVTAPPEAPAPKGSMIYICTGEFGGSKAPGECTFQDLVNAVKGLVNFGTVFALSFSIIVIAYAGFRYMISGDNAGERAKANQMLIKVAIGMAYIIGAWLIVTLILGGLGVSGLATGILK